MKRILMAAVLVVMAGGAYAADFSDLQTFKASDVKDSTMIPQEVIINKVQNSGILDNSKWAHRTTWTILMRLNFIPRTEFSDAGGLAVNDGQSIPAGHIIAAEQIDSVFMEIRGARRVEGFIHVMAIAQALSGKNMSVKDFADLIDTMYMFCQG